MTLALAALLFVSPLSNINARRDAVGCGSLDPLTGALEQSAWRHSKEMAETGTIYHSTLHIGDWSLVGEVVGVGPTRRSIVRALFRSPEHRHILLDCRYDKIALGWFYSGQVWLTGRLYAV